VPVHGCRLRKTVAEVDADAIAFGHLEPRAGNLVVVSERLHGLIRQNATNG
jgi:hypothetical protein